MSGFGLSRRHFRVLGFGFWILDCLGGTRPGAELLDSRKDLRAFGVSRRHFSFLGLGSRV